MRQVFLSKSGAIQVEDAPAPACGPGEVAIDVAYSVISTGTETASVAATDLRSRVARVRKMARLGVERLRTNGLDEVLRKAKLREGISSAMGYSVAGIVREVGSDVLDYLPGFMEHQDEPVADPVCVPLYYVSKLAVDAGIKVIQVGEGSDELFMGYPPFLQTIRFHDRVTRPMQMLPRAVRSGVHKMLSPAMLAVDRRAGSWEELLRRSVDEHPFWGGAILLNDVEKERLFPNRPPGISSWQVVAPFHAELDRRWPDADVVQHMSYVELRQRLPELLLARVDKITMSVSLEARVPFLDHRLVEYVLRLPAALKIRGDQTKAILKKAVSDLLPDDLIHRKKQGFPAPMSQWIFEDEFGRYLRDTVLNSSLIADGHLDGDVVRSYVDAHFNGQRDRGTLLWSIFNLTLWHRRWVSPGAR